MRSSRRGNLLLRNPLARGECAVRILFYTRKEGYKQLWLLAFAVRLSGRHKTDG